MQLQDASHILIIDDDSRIRALLKQYLTSHSFQVTLAGNAQEARQKLEHFVFDALVLDVMMPGESGMDFLRTLRTHQTTPVLMLTARAEAASRVQGLELGADDYLVKPFEPKELLLRLNNLLRRYGSTAPCGETISAVAFGEYVFDLRNRLLKHQDMVVYLTERETLLMLLLAQKASEPVTREELLDTGYFNNERTIDVQINRLRKKIEANSSQPVYLQTVRGRGYRLYTDKIHYAP
jgi:two-component system phosphate regulon response regulator OmpR